jgi:hypothetical protein
MTGCDLYPTEPLAALREAVDYDPETGVFIRTKQTGRNVKVGAVGGYSNRGYRRISVIGRGFECHRLAWILHYGCHPPKLIDHIDGNPANNAIANLRAATPSINTQNLKRARRDNRLGLLGVRQKLNRFEARIMIGGKAVNVGAFPTAEEAHSAYLAAKRQLHPGNTL